MQQKTVINKMLIIFAQNNKIFWRQFDIDPVITVRGYYLRKVEL